MTAELVYLVTITAYDPNIPGTTTLRYSSGPGFMTGHLETPADTWFAPRLMQPVGFKRTMFSNSRVTGGSTVGTGEIVLNNADGGLSHLRDYGIDGRSVVVQVGEQGAAISTFFPVLTGTAEQVEVGTTRVTIRLRDLLHVLAQPIQANLYVGNNSLPSGAEGTADDIKGQRKPLLFGRRYHLPPVLVNTAKLIYQIHDGTVHAVDAVYDQGVALTFSGTDRANLAALEGATITAGQYDTCKALGLFRLGGAAVGKVTVSARGDASGGYVNTAAEIVQRMLTQRCGISSGDLDSGAFSALAGASAECGIYLTGEVTRQDAIDQVLASVGGWLAPDREGVWQVGQLTAPFGSPGTSFTDADIVSLETLPTRDAGAGVPVWRVKLRGVPYDQFSAADIAGGVSEADRARLLQPWREVAESDSSVQTMHLLAPEMTRDTCLQDTTAMTSEAARLLAMHSVRRDFVRARVIINEDYYKAELGDEVRLTTARLNYGSGRDFIVVGVEPDGKRHRLILDLWG